MNAPFIPRREPQHGGTKGQQPQYIVPDNVGPQHEGLIARYLPAFDAGQAPAEARLVPFLDVRVGQCGWPLWRDGEPRICCGADVARRPDGTALSYCPTHQKRGTSAGTESDRTALRAALTAAKADR